MNKVLLDNKDLAVSNIELPCFIHGQEGSGASQFTITLAANMAKDGKRVIFFCAYSQGKAKLIGELGNTHLENITIAEPGNEAAFAQLLAEDGQHTDYVIVKNIEQCSAEIIETVVELPGLILSGDFNELNHVGLMALAKTKIFFSQLSAFEISQELPLLDRYEGFLTSESLSGKVSLEIK